MLAGTYGLSVLVLGWQVVAAAVGEGLEVPIALDQFHDRRVVLIGMDHTAALREGRDDDQ